MAAVEPYKYWAFISYSHQDKRWGDWLHKKLETYRVPHRLVGREHWSGSIPRRIFPIFRDRDELPSSADLGGVINEALRQSRYQIVICSPRAAASRWVNEEIKHFKSLGRENRLLALIVDGVPGASDGNAQSADECFPPMLRYKLVADGHLTDEVAHPVAADAREGRDGRDAALLKVIAGLLGLSYDDLRQRERRRQFWQRLQIAGAAAFTLVLAFAGTQWFLNREAAQALEARIEKFYDLGRRELLDHHEARAAVYLNEAYKLGRDTPALRFMLGQAMQAIDPLEDIRINTGGPVRRPAFSPDSKSFITPTETADGVIAQIWETATGRQLALLKGLPNAPLVTRFFPDGNRVLISGFQTENLEETSGTGAFTSVWNSSGEQLARFEGHTGRFGQPMDAAAHWLVTADAADASSARIWDLSNKKMLRRLDSGARVLAASFSPNGRYVMTGDERGEVLLWDSRIGRMVRRLPGHLSSHVVGTLFTADSKRALAFGARGDVRIWDVASGDLLLAYAADSSGFNDILLAGDGRQLITIGTEGYKVWDIERGILLFSRGDNLTNWSSAALSIDSSVLVTSDVQQSFAELLHLPGRSSLLNLERSGRIDAAAFSPDGKKLLLASGSGHVELWRYPIRLQQQFRHERRNGKFSSLYAARFDPTERLVLTASYDGTLRRWDATTGLLVNRFNDGAPLVDASYSPDGQCLVSVDTDGNVQLREAATLASVGQIKLPPMWVVDPLVFSPDSSLLGVLRGADSPSEKTLDLWRTKDGSRATTLPLDCLPTALTFVHGGDQLIVGCSDGNIQTWNIHTGARIRNLEGAKKRVWRLVQSADQRQFGSLAIDDSEVRLWDTDGGKVLDSFSLPSSQIPHALAFNESGNSLAVGSNTGKVLVRDVEYNELRVIGSHTKDLGGLHFLRNGLLLSYRADSTAKLWDPVRGELLRDVALHDWFVWTAATDDAETRLLTGGLDGVAAIWDLRAETRSPAEITEMLRCRSPWRMQGDALVPAGVASDCANATQPLSIR